MIVLTNMGLYQWNELTDTFSHEQLAKNFEALDSHNHTAGKGVQIPAGGLASLSVKAENLQENAVETAKIKNEAVTDAKLASPNNGTYRTIFEARQGLISALSAGTYIMGSNGSGNPKASGGNIASSAAWIPLTHFVKADYEVTSKTQKLRLRAQVAVNATKPTIKFTVGLYPVTVAGAANELTVTLGTVVENSKVEINEPAASTVTTGVNSDFTIPSDGMYALGVVTSGGLTANSAVQVNAQLQRRNV